MFNFKLVLVVLGVMASPSVTSDSVTLTFNCNEPLQQNGLSFTCPATDIPPCPECPTDPIPPPTASGLLYQDLVRGPIGSPVTGWCADGSTETVDIGTATTLCGDALQFEVTQGQIIQASPPTIPYANNGDLIILSAGEYTGTVNCAGRTEGWCGNGQSGVSILGQGAVVHNRIDLGTNAIDRITVAGLTFQGTVGFSGSRGTQTKTDIRIVNNTVIDAHSNSSGSFGEFSRTIRLKVIGNHTDNTGVAGSNNAHSIYHGGRGFNDDVEIAYNLVENHVGGRCIQVYGHSAGESMSNLWIHDNHTRNCQGNAAILVSHTDDTEQRSLPADERSWIDSVTVENNLCENNQLQFRGKNLNGGQDWIARNNTCALNSTMGGDPSTWVVVTDNIGPVTGNVQ